MRTTSIKNTWLIIPIALLLILGVWLARSVPTADWFATYYPAGQGLLHARSPYEQPLFVNPPWGALLVLPFSLFPAALSRGLVLVASALAIGYTVWRLKPPPLAALALFLSPTLVGVLLAGNLDAFVQLGVFLPPAWSLLLLMLKPQIGLGVAVYYAVDIWRSNEKRLVRYLFVFGPVLLAYLLSALIFPVWVDRMLTKPENIWNRSLFPYGLPLGLFFLYLAIVRRNVFFALAAGPFFAPYLTFYTYIVVQLALLHPDVDRVIRRDVLQVILCLFLWVIMLVFRL